MLPFLSFMLLAVIDLGRAYYMKVEVSNAAYTGALYGSQNPSDQAGMIAAATGDAPDVSGISALSPAHYGCECSDGSSASDTCPLVLTGCGVNAVNYVKVTTSATYKPIIPWPGLPATITLQGSAKMRAGQ
jgi:Flp pilus assembly protein TadG